VQRPKNSTSGLASVGLDGGGNGLVVEPPHDRSGVFVDAIDPVEMGLDDLPR
jgi:hypothetical protein